MGALLFKRREIFHAPVIKTRQARARAARLLKITFHGAVSVPVVFNHGQARIARRLDGLDDFLNLLILPRPVVNGFVETVNHQIAQTKPVTFIQAHLLRELAFVPRNRASAGKHMSHPQLPDPACGGRKSFVAVRSAGRTRRAGNSGFKTNLRSVISFEARPMPYDLLTRGSFSAAAAQAKGSDTRNLQQ